MEMVLLKYDKNVLLNKIDCIINCTFKMDFGWDWPAGVALYGVSNAYEITGNKSYLDLLKQWLDEKIDDGIPNLSINGVSLGHSLLSVYQATGEEKYLEVSKELASFLKNDAERFGNGVLQHTVNSDVYIFHEQAWIDTLMMAGLFLIRIGKILDDNELYNDGLNQFHQHEELLQDINTNLYYHGWDNINKNHMSGVYWARGNAWAALTMAKALEHIDVFNPSYMKIDGSLRDLLNALVRLQADSGSWHTVLDDPSSPEETSATAGIAAALLSRGTLYNVQIQKALDSLLEKITEDGKVLQVSAGTAVMPDAQSYKCIPSKRIQGWGQGLALVFLSDLLKRD